MRLLGLLAGLLGILALAGRFLVRLALEVHEQHNEGDNVDEVCCGDTLGVCAAEINEDERLRDHGEELEQLEIGDRLLQNLGDADVEGAEVLAMAGRKACLYEID